MTASLPSFPLSLRFSSGQITLLSGSLWFTQDFQDIAIATPYSISTKAIKGKKQTKKKTNRKKNSISILGPFNKEGSSPRYIHSSQGQNCYI